jgi:hypothetical protein
MPKLRNRPFWELVAQLVLFGTLDLLPVTSFPDAPGGVPVFALLLATVVVLLQFACVLVVGLVLPRRPGADPADIARQARILGGLMLLVWAFSGFGVLALVERGW